MSPRPGLGISETDKKILKVLLERDGLIGTEALARRIGVPRSTVERRRRLLETNVLTHYYGIDLSRYGYRLVAFLVETGSGYTAKIARRILDLPEAIAVSKTIGEHSIDLIAELIVKDNAQILDLTEAVKGMRGVKDVIWTEVIEEERKKKSIPDYVIDSF